MALAQALQEERRRLVAELAKVDRAIRMFAGNGSSGVGNRPKPTMSAASRAKIAKAQKARWAKIRAAKKN